MMAEPPHTPWTMHPAGIPYIICGKDGPSFGPITHGGTLKEMMAIATLMHAAPDLLAALEDALSLKGGWREAIVELEDFCSEPVRLKNMIAAADQLDRWAKEARAAIAKATLA